MRIDTRWLLVVAVLLVGGTLAVVSGAGVVGAADVELHNSTVTVTEDTDTVYAEINNSNATQANVTLDWTGIEGGNETSLNTTNVTVGANSVQLVEQSVNGSAYDSVRVVATLDNTTAPAENVTVEVGTFEKLAGGGGGLGGSGSLGIGALALVAVGALVLGSKKK